MNEIDSLEKLSELEILRRTEPTWKLASTEPFIRSPQQDVTPPEWDKSGFQNTNSNLQSQGGGGGSGGLVTFIAGEQQTDGSFLIKLITTSGTSADPP